jgi:hypothetical protein
MSPKRTGKFVRVTAYVPEEVYDKTVSFMCHNAVAHDGKPTMSNYGAISNTVSSALDSYCNIVYDYNIMTSFTPTEAGTYRQDGTKVEEEKEDV